MALSYARGFKGGYRHRQPRPCHRPWHPLARLPRPRLQHPPLSPTSTSAQGQPARLSTRQLPLQSKHLRRHINHDAPATTAGGCQPSGSTLIYLQSDRPCCSCCSRCSSYDCRGVRVYVRYATSRIEIDLVSCLVLQDGPCTPIYTRPEAQSYIHHIPPYLSLLFNNTLIDRKKHDLGHLQRADASG
jgi:hypothetical protein